MCIGTLFSVYFKPSGARVVLSIFKSDGLGNYRSEILSKSIFVLKELLSDVSSFSDNCSVFISVDEIIFAF